MILEKVSGATDIEEDMQTDGIRNRNYTAIESAVNTNSDDIAINAGNIASNASAIASNASSISNNADDLNALSPIALGFKGRNLQDLWELPTAQATFARLREISSTGDFTGLRLGDYITIPSMTIDGVTYNNKSVQIMGFDHYYGVGSPQVTTQHHVLMQFADTVLLKRMNATDTNAGGYPASELASWLNATFKTELVSAIGLTPISITRRLDTKGDWDWLAENVFLPTEVEVFGCPGFSNNYGFSVGSSYKYKLKPKASSFFWLASPRTDETTTFCSVYLGSLSYAIPTRDVGVMPAFCI